MEAFSVQSNFCLAARGSQGRRPFKDHSILRV
jgi:hypothetical protein